MIGNPTQRKVENNDKKLYPFEGWVWTRDTTQLRRRRSNQSSRELELPRAYGRRHVLTVKWRLSRAITGIYITVVIQGEAHNRSPTCEWWRLGTVKNLLRARGKLKWLMERGGLTLIGPFVFVRWCYDLHIALSLLAGYFLVENTSNSFKLKTVLPCLYQIL